MGYFGRFTEWQNYVHYLLLTAGLFIWHGLSYTGAMEQKVMAGDIVYYVVMFLWYAVGFLLIDSIIHGLFWILPEPYRWRD